MEFISRSLYFSQSDITSVFTIPKFDLYFHCGNRSIIEKANRYRLIDWRFELMKSHLYWSFDCILAHRYPAQSDGYVSENRALSEAASIGSPSPSNEAPMVLTGRGKRAIAK